MRRLLRNQLIALAVGTACAALLIEGGLRLALRGATSERALRQRLEASRRARLGDGGERSGVFGLVQASEFREVVYELKPNLLGTFRGQPMATNRHGMRQDKEVGERKSRGVRRVVGLGDSHMFGWGVAQDETYLARLQALFDRRAAAGGVEVLNCAAPGYNTATEVAVLEHKCLAFDPDLVIVHFVGNDLELPHFLQALEPTARPARSLFLWLVGALWRGERAGDGPPELLARDPGAVADPGELRRSREHYRYMAGRDGLVRALDRLAELTRPRRIPVLVLMLGRAGEGRGIVQELARRHGFEILDAAPPFAVALERDGGSADRAAWRAAYVLPGDGHPTALAHQRYAEVLLPVVQRLLDARGAGG